MIRKKESSTSTSRQGKRRGIAFWLDRFWPQHDRWIDASISKKKCPSKISDLRYTKATTRY
jgi:hypothetical protein